ncbi:hypothetical protein HDV00_003606 [Rhizophlyctis rosea]|nr:hypothetical protein HDV00_003606 [Rhizophlyctis rosea]
MPKRSANQNTRKPRNRPPTPAAEPHIRLRGSRNMFAEGFVERRDLEQYFWTRKTVEGLQRAVEGVCGPVNLEEETNANGNGANEKGCCCLCVPSLAEAFHQLAIAHTNSTLEMPLLDIDTRFAYLPLFQYFDLRRPEDLTPANFTSALPQAPITASSSTTTPAPQIPPPPTCSLLIFDPPFFYIPLSVLHAAVMHICRLLLPSSSMPKLLIGFLKREEKELLEAFREFDLKPTNFELEYSHVKPNKWRNYCLYSNVDLVGIRRVRR